LRREQQQNALLLYNHATQETATENDVSSFTAPTTPEAVGENNVSTNNFLTNNHRTARDLRLKIIRGTSAKLF